MSVLALVRHGQASFFADDYDELSAVGETQSRRLGEYWSRRGLSFSDVFVGPRRRQRRTAELVGERYRREGLSWPEPVVLEELDEYDVAGLFERLAPTLAADDRVFGRLVDAYRTSEGDAERIRTFQRMFEGLLTHWRRMPDDVGGTLESWAEFRVRVGRGVRRITDGVGRGRRVAAFTSGGVIGAAAALAVGASDPAAMELGWRLRNGSLTHLVFTPGRLTLDDFNTMPHSPDPAEWTYR